jgi:hypothetical protein
VLAVHRPRAARPFLVAVALLLLVLGSSSPARADDAVAAGDTVVGELVQACPEYASPQQASHEGDDAPLSWIDTDDVAHLQAAPRSG